MTSRVAQETLTEGALTGRVLTVAIPTTAILTEVEKTVSQEDQWMPVGRLPWTGLHSHQDLIPWMGEVHAFDTPSPLLNHDCMNNGPHYCLKIIVYETTHKGR